MGRDPYFLCVEYSLPFTFLKSSRRTQTKCTLCTISQSVDQAVFFEGGCLFHGIRALYYGNEADLNLDV